MKWTNERFIAEAVARFGDRFDYSLVDVKGKDKKVAIKCNECGTIFYQSPKGHVTSLQGGCPQCRYKYVAQHESIPFDEFKRRAVLKHGDKYIYDKSSYVGIREKVRIFCPVHGWFKQIAAAHVIGRECNLCGNEKIANTLTYSKKDFLEKARLAHGDKYDYSLVDYKQAYKNVKIICPIHGIFEQTPHNHWKGHNCPICSRHARHNYGKTSKGELEIEKVLKENDISYIKQYEIIDNNIFNPRSRMYADFYIPDTNTIIEFNGEQHYRPIKFFGGEQVFYKQYERDNALRQYCKEHKIKLIEIPYTQFNNIKEILAKGLKFYKNKV